jgi:hypothetical protein
MAQRNPGPSHLLAQSRIALRSEGVDHHYHGNQMFEN